MSSNAIKCIQLMQSFKGIYQQAHLHLGRKLIKMYMPLNAKWFNNSVINVASLFSWFGHLNHLNEFNWIFFNKLFTLCRFYVWASYCVAHIHSYLSVHSNMTLQDWFPMAVHTTAPFKLRWTSQRDRVGRK